jgi:hypothetical protein
VRALELGQVLARGGEAAQEAAPLVHDLVEHDEGDTAEQAARSQRVEVVLAHRFAYQIERQSGEERATAEGHQGRGDAGPRNPEERDERAER